MMIHLTADGRILRGESRADSGLLYSATRTRGKRDGGYILRYRDHRLGPIGCYPSEDALRQALAGLLAPKGVDYWRKLASGVMHYSTTPAQLDAIAQWCADTDARGEYAAVWHAAAVVCGYLDRCNCVPCINKRKESKS